MDIFTEDGSGVCRLKIEDSDSNYNYVLWCTQTSECAVIDPLDPGYILDFVRSRKLRVKYIINTHCHPDHIEGNDGILKVTMAKILVHPLGEDRVSPRSEIVDEGDVIDLGGLKIDILHTPGHSPEHISLLLGKNLFVGDTLFLAGCGNTKYSGDVDSLYDTIAFKLRELSDDFTIFVGHDYSQKNLRFAQSIEPGNDAVMRKLREVTQCINDGREPPPTTLGEEKKYNPFLRFNKEELVQEMKSKCPSIENDPRQVFKRLRKLRDNW